MAVPKYSPEMHKDQPNNSSKNKDSYTSIILTSLYKSESKLKKQGSL